MMKNNQEINTLTTLLNNNEKIDLTLSYSKLSDFDRNGPQSLIRRSEINNKGVKHGSLVNDLLVEKLTDEKIFTNRYYLYDDNKPTATLGELCDIVIHNYEQLPDIEEVLKIIKINDFWSSIVKEDTLIKKFDNSLFWNYLKVQFEVRNTNKVVITSEEHLACLNTVNTLLSHKYSKDIFNNDFENYYELDFSILYKNFTIRGILDIFSIDHVNKKVYMTDLKTGSGKSDSFLKSFIDYRYYYQGALYEKAFDYFCEKFNLVDYTLQPFKFLFIGKGENIPIVFEFTKKWSSAAFNGFTTKSGYTYIGINENIEKIYYHWKNNKYDFSKEIYENNGNILLNDNFIEVNEIQQE